MRVENGYSLPLRPDVHMGDYVASAVARIHEGIINDGYRVVTARALVEVPDVTAEEFALRFLFKGDSDRSREAYDAFIGKTGEDDFIGFYAMKPALSGLAIYTRAPQAR